MKIVLFDAVGTLIIPVPDVVTTYHRVAQALGSYLDQRDVQRRMKQAYRFHFVSRELDSSGLKSSDAIEKELWKKVVLEVFFDVERADQIFERLWIHFADPQNWKVYSDVVNAVRRLREAGCWLGIASNFDSRLKKIVKSNRKLAEFDGIFCSSDVGFRKPARQFYQNIQDELTRASVIESDHVDESTFYFVGDDIENDCHAPNRLGWKSAWLDRSGTGTNLEFTGRRIKSLQEFANWVLK